MNDMTALFEMEIPGTVSAAADLFEQLRRLLHARLAGSAPSELAFAMEIVAREAIQNALDYGCGRDSAKTIRFSVRERGRSFLMVVSDDGPGFDTVRTIARELGSGLGISGNGIRIISGYTDRFEYVDGGRTLIAVFFLKGGIHADVDFKRKLESEI
ncbi:MAG: hypothetical protein A2Z99_20980 [Treponema sp. GWB1_62_6]|nr:MAG: hypothetical protein A2Z99_20980 [Treponema sp. GWB1_62_6]OHE62878.1 MAG: hypothetical protein A2001_00300 [Treponema sp. GWC1_61_84]HCM26439.1 hypothetical protein [Treponema sp.]